MRLKYAVAVAGSHGKTTTTSMVATVLAAAGLDPTAVVGGKVNVLGSQRQARQERADGGRGRRVATARFLKLHPSIAVVTNIDPEHMDHYGTLDALQARVRRVLQPGAVLRAERALPGSPERAGAAAAHREALRHLRHARTPRTTGVEGSSSTASPPASAPSAATRTLGEFTVRMVGAHNALNALAVIAVAEELDIPLDTVRKALAEFGGVQRRFTVQGRGERHHRGRRLRRTTRRR